MSSETEAVQEAAGEFIRDRHRLGAYVNGLLRDAHAAEDLIQEVWMRLAKEVGKGTRLENQAAWCRAVARNLILKRWERQQSARVIADSTLLDTFLQRVETAFAEADNEAEDWAARQRALDECVAALSERSRRILTLRYESHLPMEAVADAMGLTFATVTKSLYRLRQALLRCVERKLSEG